MKNRLLQSLLLFLCLCLSQLVSAQTSWKGTSSSSWSDSRNWTKGLPTATVDAIIGDNNFTGPYQPSLKSNVACNSLTLGGVVATTLTITKNLTITGDILINTNATLSLDKATLSVNGNWTNNGSFTATGNNSTVVFGGASQSINGTTATTFRRLTVNSGSNLTLNKNVAVSSSLTVNGTLNPNESPFYTVSYSSLTVGAAGTLKVTASTFAGNYTSSSVTLSAGSTVDYAATATIQTVSNTLTYSTLRISGSGTKSLAGNLPSLNSSSATAGNILVVSGTLDLGSYTANRGTSVAGGTLKLSNGAALRMGGTTSLPANYATNTFALTSTIDYYGTNQTVAAQMYGNLNLSGSSGSATKTMPAAPFTVQGNLTSSANTGASLSYTAASNITVNGDFIIGTSTTFSGASFTHTIAGNLTNNGTITGATSTISMTGAGTAISGAGAFNFYTLNVSASNITAAGNTKLNIAGDFSTTGAGIFTHLPGGNFTMSGANKSISGASITLSDVTVSGTVTTTSNLLVAGNLSVSGSFTATAGTVTMNGTSKTISGAGTIGFSSLSIPGGITTPSNFSVAAAFDISGSFLASGGTATFSGTATLNGTANLYNITLNGTSLKLATNAVLGVANTFTITTGTLDATTSIPNTVIFNGTSAQTIPAASYYHITLANGGTKFAGGAIMVNGDFTINPTVTFNGSTFTHTLYGNWINNGTFTASTSTIQFSGAADVSITGATTFNNVSVNKSSSGNVVSLLNDISAGTVNMTSGMLKTGTKTLTITATRTGSGIILGTIKRQHTFTTGVDYEFESPYNKIRFTSVSAVTSITETITPGIINDYPYVSAINREYAISIPSGSYSASLYLHYEDPELGGNDENTMQQWSNSGGGWSAKNKTGNDATANYVYLDGITNLAQRWTLASLNNVLQWNGSTSTNWNTPANWTAIQGAPGSLPGSGDVVQIGNSAFTNQPTISTNVTVKNIEFGSVKPTSLTIASGGALTTGGNIRGSWSANVVHTINIGAQTLTVNGDLLLSDGTTNHTININAGSGNVIVGGSLTQTGGAAITFTGAGKLSIGGDFNYSSGTFTAGSNTVVYNGKQSQVVAGVSYNHLDINKVSGAAAINSATTINGNCNVTAGQLSFNSATTVAGSVTINSGATLAGGNAQLSVGGNWSNSGTFSPGSSTVILNGTSAQTLSSTTFNTLTINKPSGTATLTGNIAVNGNVTLSAGTLDLVSYSANRTSLGGVFSASSGATVLLSGANNWPANYSTYSLNTNSTVHYNGTGTQTVGGITYGNLIVSNGAANAKTLGAMVTVNGDLTINSSATLNASGYTISLGGNWTNSGTFLPATGAVLLNGSNKTITGNTTFNQVTVYGSYSVNGANITYNGLLNITPSGSFVAGSGTAIMNGDLINSGSLSSTGTTTFSGTTVQTIRLLNAINSTSTGVVNFNGTVSPIFNSTSTPTFANLNINNTGGVSPSVGWTVLGTFTIGSGASFNGGISTHTISGNFTNNGTVTSTGTLNFNPSASATIALGTNFTSSGKVLFGGSAPVAITGTPSSLNDVVIANTSTSGVAPATNWTVGRNFTINSNAVFNAGSNTYTVVGDFEGNGTLKGGASTFNLLPTDSLKLTGSPNTVFNHLIISGKVAAATDFNVSGNFTNNGTFDASIGALIMTGSGNSTISGSANPTIISQIINTKDAGAATTMGANIGGVAAMELRSGIFNTGTYTIAQDIDYGSLEIDSSAVLKIGGTNGLPVFTDYEIDTFSTVDYAGSSQPISNTITYGNLNLSTSGTATPAGALTIENNFTLNNGTFAAGNYTHNVGGNWTITGGIFTNTGSTIQFNGTTDQVISSIAPFNNVIINKTSGVLSLAKPAVVNGTLNFTSGKIVLSSNNLTMGTAATITGAASGKYIIVNGEGSLVQQVVNGGSKVFPVGNNNDYIPATVALASGSTTDNFSVRVLDAPYVNGASGTPVTTNAVNATWLISEEVTGGSNATITLQWPASLELSGFNRISCRVAHYKSGAWEYGNADIIASGTNPYTASRSGFTNFSPFTVSSFRALPVTWANVYGQNEVADNHIYWSTASEQNNSYFSIEASTDGQNFMEIAKLYSKGASTSLQSYDYVHKNVPSIVMYYRMKQVDVDGKFTYSKVIKITGSGISGISFLSGNIITSDISVRVVASRLSSTVVRVYDAAGKVLLHKEFHLNNGSNTIKLDTQPLAAGVYFISVQTADRGEQIMKFLKR